VRILANLFRTSAENAPSPRERLVLPTDDRIIYAVGDVHGCLSQLLRLEDMICHDANDAPARSKTVVILGDAIDRGPDSAGVLDHLTQPAPGGISRIVLVGNHELAMLAAFADPGRARAWFDLGGIETLRSYGVGLSSFPRTRREIEMTMRSAASMVPREHLEFLRSLPIAVCWGRYRFVHAGCAPGIPFADQSDEDLVTFRGPFLGCGGDDAIIVVHGHTPVGQPRQILGRVSVDTACYATGRLSAARLTAAEITFMTASGDRL
jgi:serine/threonine protein phosphatase 1